MRSFCANCGAPVEEGAAFCGSCGAPVQNARRAHAARRPCGAARRSRRIPAFRTGRVCRSRAGPGIPCLPAAGLRPACLPAEGQQRCRRGLVRHEHVSLVATIAVIAIISSIMDSVSSFYFSFSELQTLCTSGIVLAILALLVSIVGLILGIVGVARRNVKKGLALTGLIINGVELLADFVVIAMIAAIINELF